MKSYLKGITIGFLMAGSIPVFAQGKLHLAGTASGFSDGTNVNLISASNQSFRLTPAFIEKGSFVFEDSLPNPDLYLLLVGDISQPTVKQFQVFLDNEVVEIVIDSSSQTLIVNQGNTPKDFNDLVAVFGPKFDRLSSTAQLRKQAGGEGYFPDSLNKDWDKQLTELAAEVPLFLKNHPNTSVAAFLLNTLWPVYNNVAQIDSWIGLVSPQAMDNVFGSALNNQMKTERMFGYGSVAPDFVQNDPAGQPVSLKDFRGKYVLVDFWASWCGPCRMENPNLVKSFERFKSKNFTVLGISLDKEKNNWLKAIQDDQLNWTHVSDLKYWQNEVAKLYQISSIPQNLVLDPDGKIIAKNLRGNALEAFLEKTLGSNIP